MWLSSHLPALQLERLEKGVKNYYFVSNLRTKRSKSNATKPLIRRAQGGGGCETEIGLAKCDGSYHGAPAVHCYNQSSVS